MAAAALIPGPDGRSARECLAAARVLAGGAGLAAGEDTVAGARRGLALVARAEDLLSRQGVRVHRGGGGGTSSSAEIPTSHLPFAALPWLAAQLLQRAAPVGGDPVARSGVLREARVRVVEFLSVAQALSESFREAGESPLPMEAGESAFLDRLRGGSDGAGLDAHASRSEKVDRTRRTMASRKRLDELQDALSAAAVPSRRGGARAQPSGEAEAGGSDEDIEAEEEGWGDEEAALRRELAVLELQGACREAAGEVSLLDSELEILAHMAEMGLVPGSRLQSGGTDRPPSEGRGTLPPPGLGMPRDPHGLLGSGLRLPDGSVRLGPGDVPAGGLVIEGGVVHPGASSADAEGPGYYALGPLSSIVHTRAPPAGRYAPGAPFATRSRLEVSESERARIFQPTVALPTMTVEEYGAHARAKMERDERNAAEHAQAQSREEDMREYDQGEEGEMLREEKRMQEIATDAMKEDNPRGWGNKNQNYFARG